MKLKTFYIIIFILFSNQTAFAEKLTIFEGNNLIYHITLKDMDVKKDFILSHKMIIERSFEPISECIAFTKELKIGGTTRHLQVIPKVQLKWRGELGGRNKTREKILKIKIEHFKNKKTVSTKNIKIHTDHLDKKWITTYESGSQYFIGSLKIHYNNIIDYLKKDQSIVFDGIDILANHTFKLSICEISASTQVVFSGFDILARKTGEK